MLQSTSNMMVFLLLRFFYFTDNTNWRGAGGPCFQMKGMDFRWAAQKTQGRASRLRKKAGRATKKGSPPARPFPQPSLMCSPPAHLNLQPTGPPCSAACRPALLCSSPARGKFMFSFGNTALQPAGPPFSVILTSLR